MLWSFLLCGLLSVLSIQAKYDPNWDSLDKRPLPTWFDDVKFGIFIHWGVFSVPAFGNEWFWFRWQGNKEQRFVDYMNDNYRPNFTYADFAKDFKTEFYNPSQWASIFNSTGAKYVVLVSKHHEGYTNWPSNFSWNWNSMDVGSRRDLVGELAGAVRKYPDIKFGIYHSMFEWFHPLYIKDKSSGFQTQDFVKTKTMPELYEIVNKYKPEIVWSDGEWEASDIYWDSPNFIAWLYNESPVKDTVVVNDRWGNNTRCKHGGFWDCEDHYEPGKLVPHKWENNMPVDKSSWCYRANAVLNDYHTIEELLEEFVVTVSLGGNWLLNIGPTSRGMIPPVMEERLRQIGSWMDVNNEAIYKSKIWTHQNDTVTKNVWYTARQNDDDSTTVYAILLGWPESQNLTLGAPNASAGLKVSMVGYKGYLNFTPLTKGIQITLPEIPASKEPSQWAWTLRFEGLANQNAPLNLRRYWETRKTFDTTKRSQRPTR